MYNVCSSERRFAVALGGGCVRLLHAIVRERLGDISLRRFLGLVLGAGLTVLIALAIIKLDPSLPGIGGGAALVVEQPPPTWAEVDGKFNLLLAKDKEARNLRDLLAESCSVRPGDTVGMLCALKNEPLTDDLNKVRPECKEAAEAYGDLVSRWNKQPGLDPQWRRPVVRVDAGNMNSPLTNKPLTCGDLRQT